MSDEDPVRYRYGLWVKSPHGSVRHLGERLDKEWRTKCGHGSPVGMSPIGYRSVADYRPCQFCTGCLEREIDYHQKMLQEILEDLNGAL